MTELRPRLAAALAVILAAGWLFAVVRHASYAAGGSDSSGYLNEARMMTMRRVRLPIELLERLHLTSDWAHVFTPLGFVPAAGQPRMMVPEYPPGLPAHFAIAGAVGGWSRAPFLVPPLAGLVCLALIFVLGRQLGLPPSWSFGASAILAVCPVFLFMTAQPMSDVVATAWTLAAIVCALAAERRQRFAAAAGFAFAISVCVRPTNLLLALPLAFALRWRASRLVIAIGAALPVAAALMAWNAALYGNPWVTGYGDIRSLLAWTNAEARIPHYSYWLAAQLTPLVFPGGILVGLDRRVDVFCRGMIVSLFVVFFIFYIFYQPYEEWWYTRFLLPAIPPLIVGFLIVLRDLHPHRLIAAMLIAGVVIVGGKESRILHSLAVGKDESVYLETIRWVEQQLPPDAVVMTGLFSGAFLYYSGRPIIRYDQLDYDSFQLLRAYVGVAGLRWYALLPPWELDEVRPRLMGKWTPVGVYRGTTLLRLDW